VSLVPGSLVRARGRDWVLLPGSSDEFVLLRPLGGSEDEITGVYVPLEPIAPAVFSTPTEKDLGDHGSARLLHEAVRLSVRNSAGPFRSFGHLSFEPRPYQLVPLLMALRLDPVRLLIADDVGIGKTIEAALVARELLDRGEAQRLAVLCPPQLAEQWRDELRDKFALEAELVLTSTAARLERGLRIDESLFDRHQLVVVSTDFIKSDRRRDEFLRKAPDLVIVDEAHTCADSSGGRGQRHQRYRLVRGLADDPRRHLVLVTATPHSGNEDAFGALIGFLDTSFREMSDELGTEARQSERRRLARHLIQRRRGDIRHYLSADTPFPERETSEENYELTEKYRQLFVRALAYARETIQDPKIAGVHRQRVRWWSALALLRALGSSPAAAAETLRSRARTADLASAEDVDEAGRRTVLDLDESIEGADVVHGTDESENGSEQSPVRARLLALARDADKLRGRQDAKCIRGIELVRRLLEDGRRPIVFCRFIATAEYLKDALRAALGASVAVEAVTGTLPPAEREDRVAALAASEDQRVLIATDCLSEGINLQHGFDAVLHYDLSWNPTRHEQREGRVDRYEQPSPTVKTVIFYGRDNPIDGLVLDVLLRKHKRIRDRLGISVPVPIDSNAAVEAILEGLLLRRHPKERTDQLVLFEDVVMPERERLHKNWDSLADREKRSRTVFAQETIKVEEVTRELDKAARSIGSAVDVQRFVCDVITRAGGVVDARQTVRIDVREIPVAVRDVAQLTDRDTLQVRFGPPARRGVELLNRTSPVVEGLAAYVLESALDPQMAGPARRAGVIRTRGVTTRTTLLVLRVRYDVIAGRAPASRHDVAEESRIVSFTGPSTSPTWLDERHTLALLELSPDSNVSPEQSSEMLSRFAESRDELTEQLDRLASTFADELQESHRRVRADAGLARSTIVKAHTPVDVVGVFAYLPSARS
jgi:superfamily II DNA or RNA helicase